MESDIGEHNLEMRPLGYFPKSLFLKAWVRLSSGLKIDNSL